MGLGKIFTKKCTQSHVSSLWRLTWVFDATWKVSTKKVWPVTRFFAVETNLSFWWDLEKFSQKSVPSHTFLRCGDYLKFLRGLGKVRQKGVTSYTVFRSADYLKFLMGLGKIFTKKCAQSHVSSLWRLTWVFDGTWKNFHKKVCPVTRFFAVETILSFWVDLESFDKKVWPVTHFFRSADYLKFLMGLGKFRQKIVISYTVFRSAGYLKFLMGLEKFSQKSVPSYTFCSLWRLTWVFDGTWKVSTKKVWPVTRFFAVETNLSFWWDLEKFSQKSVPSHTFLRCGDYLKFLTGLGKFRQKSVPSHRFLRCAYYLEFLMGLGKIFTKKCAQSHVSSLWRLTWVFDATWKSSTKKVWPVTRFFAVETNLSFWWDLEKFSQKSVPSHTFLRCGDYLKFLMGLGKIFTKKCAQSHVSSLWRLS